MAIAQALDAGLGGDLSVSVTPLDERGTRGREMALSGEDRQEGKGPTTAGGGKGRAEVRKGLLEKEV